MLCRFKHNLQFDLQFILYPSIYYLLLIWVASSCCFKATQHQPFHQMYQRASVLVCKCILLDLTLLLVAMCPTIEGTSEAALKFKLLGIVHCHQNAKSCILLPGGLLAKGTANGPGPLSSGPCRPGPHIAGRPYKWAPPSWAFSAMSPVLALSP